jgi:hypothetical protein
MTAGESLLAIREVLETVWFALWRLRLGSHISRSTTLLTNCRPANEWANVSEERAMHELEFTNPQSSG